MPVFKTVRFTRYCGETFSM